jgi:ankyrin repeat protein
MSLQQAVATGNVREVKENIAAKTDLNKVNQDGWTPIQVAAMNGNLTIVQMLAEGGADFRKKGKGGKTALDLARDKGKTDVVQYFEQRASKGGRGLIDGGLGVSEVLDNP